MATAKERHIQAELMKDPAYAEAWDDYRRTVREIVIGDPDAGTDALIAAGNRIYQLLESRPDLLAIAELAEAENH